MKRYKAYTLIFVLAVLIYFFNTSDLLTVKASERAQQVSDKVVIVIDPGHGGDNEGTKENAALDGVLEKEMTLKTAQAMYDELCKYDNAEVYMTRTTDTGLSLDERAEFAESVGADFLFSIHYNASLSHELYGTEVWISSIEPYHTYGYQFGCIQMSTMNDMGLFLRGVKTRLTGDKANGKEDYYGIIKHSVERSIPAAIIEHCHVDNAHDTSYCDSDEDLEAFGRADALSVAKYFRLYSTSLGVDYRVLSSSYADTSSSGTIRLTLNDYEKPDICQIELETADYNTGAVNLSVSAADYSNLIISYDYSIDGGETYSERIPWPDSNILTGTYTDTPVITISIPSGTKPDIILRAYNMYDMYAESNVLSLDKFTYEEAVAADAKTIDDNPSVPADSDDIITENSTQKDSKTLPGTTTFKPDEIVSEDEDGTVSFTTFIIICIIIALILIATVIVSQLISDSRRRKRRRRRREG
jgi:N-acetylmuramoyl-L-alanine amidase